MRVVVKVGSSSLTDEHGRLREDVVTSLVAQIAQMRASGHEVVLVTSGAVAAGVGTMGLDHRPTDILALQALSAVGQPQLMSAYNERFARHRLLAAQVLLVANDFIDRTQYLHARDTLGQLLEYGCIPVVNENDAIASTEIRYGDNDHLSALVAHLVSADLLVLLTDTDGLYTADPRDDPSASLIETVTADDPLLAVRAAGVGSDRGSGGMATKLAAARIASWSGVTAVIAPAADTDVLRRVVDGAPGVGTRFLPRERQLSARKLWIAFAAEVTGRIVVDDGAKHALIDRGTSLLPAGVLEVEGHFVAGDTVEICDREHLVFARGMVAVSSSEAAQSKGLRSEDRRSATSTELIHRDDLVLVS